MQQSIRVHERSCRDRHLHAGAVVTATRVAQRSPTTNHFFMALNFISTSITLIFNARCENQQTDSHSLANETLARSPLSDKSCSTCSKMPRFVRKVRQGEDKTMHCAPTGRLSACSKLVIAWLRDSFTNAKRLDQLNLLHANQSQRRLAITTHSQSPASSSSVSYYAP